MAKTTTIFTISLLIISLFLGVLTYLYKNTPNNNLIKPLMQGPTAIPLSQTALTISPEMQTTQAGKLASVNIAIGSDGNYPTEVQLELSYDPTTLTNLKITPGSFLPNAKVLLNNIDTRTGRISYVLTLPNKQQPVNKSGTIATITFIPTVTKPETQILFLPKTTIYSFKQQAILKQAIGADIIIATQKKIASQSANPIQPIR